MARTWIRRPHVLALVAAAVLVIAGIVLLVSPADGAFGALAWVAIVVGVALGAFALFFARTPKS